MEATTKAPKDKAPTGPARRRAALLINLGTPASPEVADVRRYLAEFLSDPAVIRLPFGVRWVGPSLARLIAQFRGPRSAEAYRKIWTPRGSPLRTITEDQAQALEAVLPRGWRVFVAMRYGEPSIGDTLRQIEAERIQELVILPLYPHFSWPTTGTALNRVYEYLKSEGEHPAVTTNTSWHDDYGYIRAQADLIREFADSRGLARESTYLLFSTHGLPVSYVRRGDPYADHVTRSVELIVQRLDWPQDRTSLAYQSRFGPVKWLRPYTDEVLRDLARAGRRDILVCPISFTADCLETLEEIGIRYRQLVESEGGRLHLCPCLNTYEPFISALKRLILSGPRPMAGHAGRTSTQRRRPRDAPSTRSDLDSMVMIGVSLPGRVHPRYGPQVGHSSREALHRVKRPQHEVAGMLRGIQEAAGLGDVWLWNTCRRYELFARLSGAAPHRDRALTQLREALVTAAAPADLVVDELHGVAVWHHILRTAAGLNSDLPGERDVIEQLRAAYRLADQAGTAGPFVERLVDDVFAIDRELRDATRWGEYHPDYAYAAMSGLLAELPVDVRDCRLLVVGGSTTSASVLRMLTDRFQVPSRQLTLVYRGHKKGGQIKMLRRAIGHGRRVRVQTYRDAAVTEAVREADVVVFGTDYTEPILTTDRIDDLLHGRKRRLTLFDFNVFGSTEGCPARPGVRLFDAERLEAEAQRYADELCRAPDFNEAVEEAEAWIVWRALDAPAEGGPVLDRPNADRRADASAAWSGPAGAADRSASSPHSATGTGVEATCPT